MKRTKFLVLILCGICIILWCLVLVGCEQPNSPKTAAKLYLYERGYSEVFPLGDTDECGRCGLGTEICLQYYFMAKASDGRYIIGSLCKDSYNTEATIKEKKAFKVE